MRCSAQKKQRAVATKLFVEWRTPRRSTLRLVRQESENELVRVGRLRSAASGKNPSPQARNWSRQFIDK